MTWLSDWWNGMSVLQQCFAVVAIPATVVLFLQTVLLLIGIGGSHDIDHGEFSDGSGHDFTDGHLPDHSDAYDSHDDAFHDTAHHSSGLRIFTVRGIVAFFAVGGWLGIVLCDTALPSAAVIIIAFAGGFLALLVIALFLKMSLKLQDQGNLELKNAIGKTAQVYIPIPANGGGSGKVTLTLQERYVELSAITTAHTALHTDQMVKVVGIVNQSTLVVKPLNDETVTAAGK